ALSALCAVLLPVAAAAAKKHKTPSVFQQQLSPNASIPDDAGSGPSTPVTSAITVGKKFKGKVVGDVNVTGIQTTGNAKGALNDLGVRISAPNGQAVTLLAPGFASGASMGPLTFDDDVFVEMCYSPPCQWAPQTLNPPYVGTANLMYNSSAGTGPLAQLNGSPMKGTWTFTVWDASSVGQTSVLNSWGLQITPRKPVK